MKYLLDSDVFIQAKNLHYGLDFCPAFWDWLVASDSSGLVFSIEKVGDEIEAVADELTGWAAVRGDGFFLKPDAAILPALATVSSWAAGPKLRTGGGKHLPAQGRFLPGGARAGSRPCCRDS